MNFYAGIISAPSIGKASKTIERFCPTDTLCTKLSMLFNEKATDFESQKWEFETKSNSYRFESKLISKPKLFWFSIAMTRNYPNNFLKNSNSLADENGNDKQNTVISLIEYFHSPFFLFFFFVWFKTVVLDTYCDVNACWNCTCICRSITRIERAICNGNSGSEKNTRWTSLIPSLSFFQLEYLFWVLSVGSNWIVECWSLKEI